MNEKDLYLKFNTINVDEHEFDHIDAGMTNLQIKRLKKNLRKTIRTKKPIKSKIALSCAALIIFIVGIVYINPALAENIPFLDPIATMLGGSSNYADYSDIVNKTVSCNGKSFTINSVVCYDNNLIIGYTVKNNTKLDATGPLFFPTYKVNGKWLNEGTTGGQQNLNSNTAIGTIQISSDVTLPQKFNFEMSFNSIDDTSGNWDFKFDISKAELSKNTKTYQPNQVIKYGHYDFTIDKITLTPLSTIISQHSSSQSMMPFFPIILDNQENEISQGGGATKENPGRFDITSTLAKTNLNAKYLTIVPYFENNEANSVTSVPLKAPLPINLSQGKIGRISINSITFSENNDKAIIEGIIYGKLPKFRSMCLSLEGDNPKADTALLNTSIQKIGADKYKITKEYSGLKNDKNYKLTVGNLDNIIDYNARITVMLK